MSEVFSISGTIGGTHGPMKRGDHVRILVDGVIDARTEKDTAHKGTEYKLNIRSEAGYLLNDQEASAFDDQIAEMRAMHGDNDPRQTQLGDGEGDDE